MTQMKYSSTFFFLLYFVVLVICLPGPLFSQVDTGEPGEISFQKVQIAGGGLANRINGMVQDSLGYLWISSHRGLHKYDGYQFTTYKHKPDDPTSLASNYMGTVGDGLHQMNRSTGKFTRFPYNPDNPNQLSRPHLKNGTSVVNGVSFIQEDQSGILWIGGFNGGLNRYNPRTGAIKHFEWDLQDPNSFDDNFVWRFYQTRDGTIWIGHGSAEGLDKVVQPLKKIPLSTPAESISEAEIIPEAWSIYEDSKGNRM